MNAVVHCPGGRAPPDHGQLRITEESGENYLYPSEYFAPVELPHEVVLRYGSQPAGGR